MSHNITTVQRMYRQDARHTSGGLRGENGGSGGAMLIPNELVLLLGILTSVPMMAIIDQEMLPSECGQTDTVTDSNRFYNLSHAICYSYGTDNNRTLGQRKTSTRPIRSEIQSPYKRTANPSEFPYILGTCLKIQL